MSDETFPETLLGTASPMHTASEPWPSIPGFEILEELGRGGMGVVYKARQAALNRLVAIKMVLPGSSAEVRGRFQSEAEAVARLHHPHLVAVHEVGSVPSPFLVMDFVGGGTLEDRLGGVPQPPAAAALLAANLALAVQHAHAASVVHRDLKPSNILMAEDGSPRITDFGLARLADRSSGLTMSGAIMGTPGYMAPEQARGDNDAVGPPADVWALGAILYQMLTGRPPFLGAAAMETMRQVLDTAPAPPRRLLPSVPADLETICLKCLNKTPAHRYATAGELADDLERWRNHEPIRARPAGVVERTWKWVLRQPAQAALYVVSAMAVFGMLLGTWRHNRALGQALAEARASDEENRQSLIRMDTMQGLRALDDGHAADALSWFAAAHAMEPKNPLHRMRFGTALRTMPELTGLAVHEGAVRALAISRDGKRLLAAGDDKHLRVWAQGGKDPVQVLALPSAVVHACFGSREEAIVLAGEGGEVRIESGKGALDLKPHKGRVTALEEADGRILTAGEDGLARLWLDGEKTPREWKHPAALLAASMSLDGKRVATGCADGKARLFDVGTGKETASCPHPGRVLALAWNPAGDRLATACADGGIRVWDPDGKTVLRVMRHRAAAVSVAFGARGERLLSSSDDGRARVWDSGTGEMLAMMRHSSGINGASFSPDGRLVLTFGDDGDARIWWAESGEPATPWLSHSGCVSAACFAPDGKAVATASLDRTARVWKVPALGEPAALRPWHHSGRKKRWAGPSGRVLAAEGDHAARLLPDGPLLVHGSAVLYAAFGADGTRVVTGSDDNMARIWEPATGRLVGRVMPHGGSVRLACFGPGGTLVATASDDGTCRVWCAHTGLPVSPAWPAPVPPESMELEEGKLVLRLPGGAKAEHQLATADGKGMAAKAALLSGRRVDALHGLLPLPVEELLELWKARR